MNQVRAEHRLEIPCIDLEAAAHFVRLAERRCTKLSQLLLILVHQVVQTRAKTSAVVLYKLTSAKVFNKAAVLLQGVVIDIFLFKL